MIRRTRKSVGKKRLIILTALLLAAASSISYADSNDDFSKSLSNYENRVKGIYQQLDYTYRYVDNKKDVMGVILKAKNALHKLELDMNEDEERLFGKGQAKSNDSGENGNLTDKLKTLNKLLADRVITKDNFEQQKKRLLDNYTEKTN